jgi:hypothetical protein
LSGQDFIEQAFGRRQPAGTDLRQRGERFERSASPGAELFRRRSGSRRFDSRDKDQTGTIVDTNA